MNSFYNPCMIIPKSLLSFIFLLLPLQSFCQLSLAEQFKRVGCAEICDKNHGIETFDVLYMHFDKLIEYLQTHPKWAQKLYAAKERFIRSKDRNYYSTDFFGFYDESASKARGQVAFYYSTHFHEFICSYYPELKMIPEIIDFLQACREIQKPYGTIFDATATELGLKTIFSSTSNTPPILFKVVKYLPSYRAMQPHYDGTAFSLFLDSTDNQSLLLSPYKSSLIVQDFSSPIRTCSRESTQNSILLIPGVLLTEFSIYPTPHIVLQSGKTRYATIAFAMRPHHSQKNDSFTLLPHFNYDANQ